MYFLSVVMNDSVKLFVIYLTGDCALPLLFRVLIGDVQGIIEKQTVNDTVNARGSSSYYENYHSMKEVSYFCCKHL